LSRPGGPPAAVWQAQGGLQAGRKGGKALVLRLAVELECGEALGEREELRQLGAAVRIGAGRHLAGGPAGA
jgi:hypothetical protein